MKPKKVHEDCHSPPEYLIGADKLFEEARVERFKGPLKLGALLTDGAAWCSLSDLSSVSKVGLLLKAFSYIKGRQADLKVKCPTFQRFDLSLKLSGLQRLCL